jgi:hypothetical protein
MNSGGDPSPLRPAQFAYGVHLGNVALGRWVAGAVAFLDTGLARIVHCLAAAGGNTRVAMEFASKAYADDNSLKQSFEKALGAGVGRKYLGSGLDS